MDPRLRHKNYAPEFGGNSYDLDDDSTGRDLACLDAIRRFIAAHGRMPTQDSWTAAGMVPSERTVRRRFGSFAAAAEAVTSVLLDF